MNGFPNKLFYQGLELLVSGHPESAGQLKTLLASVPPPKAAPPTSPLEPRSTTLLTRKEPMVFKKRPAPEQLNNKQTKTTPPTKKIKTSS